MSYPNRGEIWQINCDISSGIELEKNIAVLVISNNIANEKCLKLTVLPISSKIKKIPIIVIIESDPLNGLSCQSLIKIPDIFSIDKSRLKIKIGKISEEKLHEVESKLKIHLNL